MLRAEKDNAKLSHKLGHTGKPYPVMLHHSFCPSRRQPDGNFLLPYAVLKYIFNWRFWIAEITKKSKAYRKVIDKMLFEDDEIIVVPNTININKKMSLIKRIMMY